MSVDSEVFCIPEDDYELGELVGFTTDATRPGSRDRKFGDIRSEFIFCRSVVVPIISNDFHHIRKWQTKKKTKTA